MAVKSVHPAPVPDLEPASVAFGVSSAAAREQLEALNGSLLLLAKDEVGLFWDIQTPDGQRCLCTLRRGKPRTRGDLSARRSPRFIVYEVVCAGSSVYGAPVIVPDSLHSLLAERILRLEGHVLVSFLSYRSNRNFSKLMLERRPVHSSETSEFLFSDQG